MNGLYNWLVVLLLGVFTTWFVPIGILTLVYAILAERQTGLDSIWPVASLLLFASLVAHSLSATLFSRRMEGYEGAVRLLEQSVTD